MKLSDLKKSITDMSEEELREHILAIRASRRTNRNARSAESHKKNNKAASNVSIETLFSSLSKEDAERLLKQMGG